MIRDADVNIYDLIYSHINKIKVVNTHSHNVLVDTSSKLDFHDLLSKTYCTWTYNIEDSDEGYYDFFEKMSTNSYGYWLFKAIGDIYNDGIPLSYANYRAVKQKYEKSNLSQSDIFKNHCGYEIVILDDYRDPGNSHGFAGHKTAVRCDMFLRGHDKNLSDANGNSPYNYLCGERPRNFKEYISKIKDFIDSRIAHQNTVAIKFGIAYMRNLEVDLFDSDMAEKAFCGSKDKDHIKAFEDCTVLEICKHAAQKNLPVQIHTGLGCLDNTRAIRLKDLIKCNKNTKFVLFHASFPWESDVLALAHTFDNVYIDLCWTPLLSTAYAESFLDKIIDVTTSEKISWGCDTMTAEESYGALLAAKHVITKVLANKVQNSYYNQPLAIKAAENILCNNSKSLFRF